MKIQFNSCFIGILFFTSNVAWPDGSKVMWCSYDIEYTGFSSSTPEVSNHCECVTPAKLHENIGWAPVGGGKVFEEKDKDGKVVHVRMESPGNENSSPSASHYYRGKIVCETARRIEKKHEEEAQNKDAKEYKKEEKGYE